jgi:hypothetical protein
MNLAHRWLCRSAYWRNTVETPRPPKVGINYRYVSERWHRLTSELGYSRYGSSGYDFSRSALPNATP